jgi:coproporphyrinogen III oxidase
MKNSTHTYKIFKIKLSQLEAVDGHAKFREDLWERLEGGGGRTRYRKWSCFLKRWSKCFCGAW